MCTFMVMFLCQKLEKGIDCHSSGAILKGLLLLQYPPIRLPSQGALGIYLSRCSLSWGYRNLTAPSFPGILGIKLWSPPSCPHKAFSSTLGKIPSSCNIFYVIVSVISGRFLQYVFGCRVSIKPINSVYICDPAQQLKIHNCCGPLSLLNSATGIIQFILTPSDSPSF